MNRSVIIEREFKHRPEKVWRALTQGALIEDWLMKNDFRPVEGHRFRFRAEPMPQWDGIVEGKVLTVEPLKRLSYRWDAGENLRTVVTWTLTETPAGTHLRMEQSGFRPEDEFNYRGAGYGWQKFIAALDDVLGRLE